MLPTKKIQEITPTDDSKVVHLHRSGVVKDVEIPVAVLSDKVVSVGCSLDAKNKCLKVARSKTTELLTLTGEIGVSDNTVLNITFINNDTALVQLIEGSMALKNIHDVPYCFTAEGALVKAKEMPHLKWLSVKELMDYTEVHLRYKFNVSSNMYSYVYNAMFTLSFSYYDNGKHETSVGTWSLSTKLLEVYSTLACGEFDYVVQAKRENRFALPPLNESTPTKKVAGAKKKKVSAAQAMKDMLHGDYRSSESCAEDEDYSEDKYSRKRNNKDEDDSWDDEDDTAYNETNQDYSDDDDDGYFD